MIDQKLVMQLVEAAINVAETKYPSTTFVRPVISFDNAMTMNYVGYFDPNTNHVHLNPKHMVAIGHFIESVFHEMAHWVVHHAYYLPVKDSCTKGGPKPHGPEWQIVMRDHFGFNLANVVFDSEQIPAIKEQKEKNPPRRQRRWEYKCDCTKFHAVATVSHNRIQKGSHKYNCKDCNQELTWTGNEIPKEKDLKDYK